MKQAKIFVKHKTILRNHIRKSDRRTKQDVIFQYIGIMTYERLRPIIPRTNKTNKFVVNSRNELLLDLYDHWESQVLELEEFNK